MKNLSVMGGLLYVMVFGAGPLSLDALMAQPTPASKPPGKK